MTTFTYKCVDCGTKNEIDYPPMDNMLSCSKCGFPTVQVCVKVTHSNKVGSPDRNVSKA